MTRELLTYGPVLLAWAAAAYKLRALSRRPHDRALRAYWLALLTLALSLTVLLPPSYLAIDRLVGIPNLARLLAHGLMLVAGWSVLQFLFHLNFPDAPARQRGRRDGWILLGALVLLASLFSLAGTDEEALDFTSHYADAPFILEYRLVLLAYLGFTLTNVARLSWRYAELSRNRPALHLGLRLVALGGLVGLGYVVHGVLYLVARKLGLGYPLGGEEIVSEALVAGCVALVVIGSTMPGWGPRVGIPTLYRWAAQHRSLWRLYPLWRDLCHASPDIALLPLESRLADALAVRDLGFRLYRRVVEVRDGRLALRPYVDPRVAEDARARCREVRLSDEEAEVVVEAASLAAAVRAKLQGRAAGGVAAVGAIPGGADVMSEVAVLERIARCYTRSPIVWAAVARCERQEMDRAGHVGRLVSGR